MYSFTTKTFAEMLTVQIVVQMSNEYPEFEKSGKKFLEVNKCHEILL